MSDATGVSVPMGAGVEVARGRHVGGGVNVTTFVAVRVVLAVQVAVSVALGTRVAVRVCVGVDVTSQACTWGVT